MLWHGNCRDPRKHNRAVWPRSEQVLLLLLLPTLSICVVIMSSGVGVAILLRPLSLSRRINVLPSVRRLQPHFKISVMQSLHNWQSLRPPIRVSSPASASCCRCDLLRSAPALRYCSRYYGGRPAPASRRFCRLLALLRSCCQVRPRSSLAAASSGRVPCLWGTEVAAIVVITAMVLDGMVVVRATVTWVVMVLTPSSTLPSPAPHDALSVAVSPAPPDAAE